ncbi:four helix bundle protein [Candidatus Uhrbacteria bacterium]|nr:four helix bundle protein [Candidatus Uhrbacteria bacterium]
MNSTPAFQKSYDFYKNLYLNLRQIPKRDRFTWGERCETLAIDLLSRLSKATYAPRQIQRLSLLEASDLIDRLKIYLRLGADLKILDQKKYFSRVSELIELGKMIGGWLKTV